MSSYKIPILTGLILLVAIALLLDVLPSNQALASPDQPPNQPSNISPTDRATDVSLTPILQSSAFSDPDVGDTHSASHWQITLTSGDYSSPVFDSNIDAINLTQIAIPSGILDCCTSYYWHVKHQDSNSAWSTWSSETSFTPNNVVTFPDSNLEVAIKKALGKPEGAIDCADLEGLTVLNAKEKGIKVLTGLGYCTNLTELRLWGNQISDISPLSNLTNLTKLGLGTNQISDISPLSNLTNLTRLGLGANQISDISPLGNLNSLTKLRLQDNQISDIEPLVGNTGLSDGDTVDLENNPLSTTSVNVYIWQLEGRGLRSYGMVPTSH